MDTLTVPAIAFAERLKGGVIIAFIDGKTALYSASLLYENFTFAMDLTHLHDPDDDPE